MSIANTPFIINVWRGPFFAPRVVCRSSHSHLTRFDSEISVLILFVGAAKDAPPVFVERMQEPNRNSSGYEVCFKKEK